MAGEQEQVVAVLQREMQAAGDRGEHLLGRVRPALLLDARVVVGGHAAERRHLLAPQSTGTPALPAGQPDVLRLQRLASLPQEVG
jgi:hypothetical protein